MLRPLNRSSRPYFRRRRQTDALTHYDDGSMRIGIDLGGTKIEGDRARGRWPRAVAAADRRRRAATTSATLAAVERPRATPSRSEAGARGTVGVGIPGAISPATGLIKNANSTWLNGRPLAEDLSRRLERPVRFANDANCFALSEATDGAAAGARRRVRRDHRHRHRRRRRGRRPRAGRRRTRSPASGGTTRCPGRAAPSARPAVLLRAARLHRDVPLGPGAGARLRRRWRRESSRAKIVAARAASASAPATRRSRATKSRMARALGDGHQPARPRRHRARRRAVEHRRGSTGTSRAVVAATFSPTASTRAWCAPRHGDSSGVRGAAWLWDEK